MGIMKRINCPQCGAEIAVIESNSKISVCNHCSSTLFIENSTSFTASITTNTKANLIQVNKRFSIRSKNYIPLNFIQYQYEQGIRTEWHVIDENKNMFWLTQDDENYSLVAEVNNKEFQKWHIVNTLNWDILAPNFQTKINHKDWLVTERRVLYSFKNTPLKYSYLTGDDASLLILIFDHQYINCRSGFWLDPFEIKHES